jgi:hypothetical protein
MNSIDKPYTPRAAEEPTQDRTPDFNAANAVDDLVQLIAKTDALAHAARDLYDEVPPTEVGEVRRRRERLAHLISDTAEGAEAALKAAKQLADHLAKRRMGA